MRLPDDFRSSVFFLGTRDGDGGVRYRGTAFVAGMAVHGRKDLYHAYLVTAAHCIRRAQEVASPLCAGFNMKNGESAIVDLTSDWIFPDDDAIDLAVLPYDPDEDFEIGLLPVEGFANNDLIRRHDFGIGDEVYAMGLFYFRHGKTRNLPVLRSGMLASMPDEPMQDERTGRPYDAYLIEMRSFGGLSGTPVFTVFQEGMILNRPSRHFSPLLHHLSRSV